MQTPRQPHLTCPAGTECTTHFWQPPLKRKQLDNRRREQKDPQSCNAFQVNMDSSWMWRRYLGRRNQKGSLRWQLKALESSNVFQQDMAGTLAGRPVG